MKQRPDWATRLQRTFQKKYNEGYQAGLADAGAPNEETLEWMMVADLYGRTTQRELIIKWFEEEDSACSSWAIGVIERRSK